MADLLNKDASNVEQIASILLSTLDESIFFIELSNFLAQIIGADKVMVFKATHEETSARLLLDSNKKVSKEEQNKEYGLINQAVRTKKPYFSNCVDRDPLFEGLRQDHAKSALCLPVCYENSVIAALLFLSTNEKKKFSLEDITQLLAALKDLKSPIGNMKMYLAAVHLNETLLRKIEMKDKELEENKVGLSVADNYRINEKDMVGKSKSFQQLLSLADKLAINEVSYLIEGETGTGKETIARRIHCRSSRRDKGLAMVDCAGMDEMALEMEIFGNEQNPMKKGLLELVNNGTMVLSNIHQMGLNLQKKLYQFLEEGRALRVGGQVPYRSNVRLVATANKNLTQEITNKTFREDLYFAISKITLQVSALRERREDIEVLANYFLNKGRPNDEHKILSPGAIQAMFDYSWPNNIEELQNVVERAFILAEGQIIEKDHLMEKILKAQQEEKKAEGQDRPVFQEMTLEELERRYICSTLEYLGGNKTKTAKTLGITVKTLYNKLHNYGLIDQKEAVQ
ncbi:MAG: sigma 54-interacting transcriptional regulator [Pseudomonadota bacterium]